MKNKIKYICLGALLAFSTFPGLTMAKTTSLEVLKKKISLDVPEDWEIVNKEVGVPLKLIGPMYEERRPVLLFVPLDMKEERLDFSDKKKAEDSYKIGRLAWLQTFNGKTISFLPMKTYKTNNNKIEFNQFGHLYQLDNANFEEKSFYVKCNGGVFHFKTLIQVEHVEKWTAVVKKMTDSFRCE